MASNSGLPFLLRVLSWIGSIFGALTRFVGKRRDAGLKKYNCKLNWNENGHGVTVMVDVKAENEDQARRFANEAAIKRLPILKMLVGGITFTPPYMQDAKAALSKWQVAPAPLSDIDKDQMEAGEFGPAGVSGTPGWQAG